MMKVLFKKYLAKVWREGTYNADKGLFLDKLSNKQILKKDVVCYLERENIVYLKVKHGDRKVKNYASELRGLVHFRPLDITPEEFLKSTDEFVLKAKIKSRKREIKLIRWYFIASMMYNGHRSEDVGACFQQGHSNISHVCKSVLELFKGPDVAARLEFYQICEAVINNLEK